MLNQEPRQAEKHGSAASSTDRNVSCEMIVFWSYIALLSNAIATITCSHIQPK